MGLSYFPFLSHFILQFTFAQSNLDMQIKRDGAGMVLPLSQQNLDNIKIDGLVPEILSIKSAAEVPLFTGTGIPGR